MSACTCIDDLNTRLKDGGHNSKLTTMFTLDGSRVGRFVKIETEVIEKKRGAKPVSIMPSYCPFCGVSLEVQPDAAIEIGGGAS